MNKKGIASFLKKGLDDDYDVPTATDEEIIAAARTLDTEKAVLERQKQDWLEYFRRNKPSQFIKPIGGVSMKNEETLKKTSLHSGSSVTSKIIQGAMGVRKGLYKVALNEEERGDLRHAIIESGEKMPMATLKKYSVMTVNTVTASPRSTSKIVDFVADITFDGVGEKSLSFRVTGETDGFDIGQMKWDKLTAASKSTVSAHSTRGKKSFENANILCINGVELQKNKKEEAGQYVPKAHYFEPEPKLIDKLMIGLRDNLPVLMIGPTGAGKTSMIRWLASKTNHAYRRLNLNGATTVDDFVGRILLSKEGTYWVDGVLLDAMKNGYWLMLDEVNAALPEILFVLHSLMDDDRMVVVAENDGAIVRPHPDFRLVAAMNPAVDYVGTKELNKAFLSRFPIVLEVDYLPEEKEIEVLRKS